MVLCWVVTARAILSSLFVEVLAVSAHGEEGNDVGENDGDDATGGCLTDFELQQRLLVDEEGQIGGGIARAAIGGDQDLGIDREQEDRLDQDDDGDGARNVRQSQKPVAV